MAAAQHFAGLVAQSTLPGKRAESSRRREIAASKPIKDQVEKVAVAYLKHAKARTRESTFTETKRAFDRTNFVRMARSAPIGNHKKPMFESLSAGSPTARRRFQQIEPWRA